MQLFPHAGNLEKEVVDLYLEVAIGATGAVGAYTRKRGIASIARQGAGDYIITLANPGTIIDWNLNIEDATVTAGDGLIATSKGRTSGAAPTLRVQFVAPDDEDAAEVAEGAKIVGRITVKRTQD